MSITEFLTARYGEDEERATAGWDHDPDERWEQHTEGRFVLTPRGVLLDLAVKRTLLTLHPAAPLNSIGGGFTLPDLTCRYCTDPDGVGWQPYPCLNVQLLAQPYVDHPDFDPAWEI
jgi:hypothetical protein